MRTLVIDRTKWLRGVGGSDSGLLRPSSGKMCCLGFECLANGYTEDNIRNMIYPEDLRTNKNISHLVYDLGAGYYHNTLFTNIAAQINDKEFISDVERESSLSEHFLTENIQLEFIN